MNKIIAPMIENMRNVIVFSRTPLLGEGILKLLSDLDQVRILGLAATISEVRELAENTPPSVIIMNQDDSDDFNEQALAEFLDISSGQVLSFTLAEQDMVIYTLKRVPASIQELLNALGTDTIKDANE